MKCKNCGFENRSSVKFCEECGQALDKPARIESTVKHEGMTCPSCGHANRPEVKFCEECGHALGSPARAGSAMKPAKTACPSCGHANRPGIQFCEECGASLQPSRARGLIAKAGRFPLNLNFKRAAIAFLVFTVLAAFLAVGFDRLQYPVSKADARSKADAVIQAYYPELTNVTPQVSEYENENGETLMSYTYTSVINAQDENGTAMQFTVGAVVIVDRKTGQVEVITIH